MNLASLSINRPVLATVMSIILVLFGLIGFNFLGIREYPSVDPPTITVSTSYTGANADVMESQITEPLEESINGIAGISSLASSSSDGRSSITVEFELGTDLEAAANDVRDRVSRAMRLLPPDADPPVVVKSDADANPILSITIQSEKRNLLELSDIANNVFKERLQTVPGVSEVSIWGEKKYAMRLFIDPAKLSAYGLTPLDVRDALNRENVELPSGRIEGSLTELTIRTLGRLNTPQDFNNLIIKENVGSVVRFRDIGYAELGALNDRTILRGNSGIPMVAVAIIPQAGSNYVAIADEVYNRIEQLKTEIPADLKLGMALDATKSIRKSIKEVEETILIAFILVVLVIFLFLREWRTTLIPVIAIPISLIATFFIMYLADFSINVLTLLGIVLATGLVVDDAIVVLENIYAKIEKGMNPIEAGHQGSREIIFAIISTTITLAAVFLPIIFLQGLTGRLFREFGMVVASSVIISAFVSLTLTPMMSARLLKHHQPNKKSFFYRTEPFFIALTQGYSRWLNRFMSRRWTAVAIMLLSILLIFGLGSLLKSELAPLEDKSRIQLSVTASEGTSYEEMDRYMLQLIALTDTLREKESILQLTAPGFGGGSSVNRGFVRVMMVDPELREKSQQELADELGKQVAQYNQARTIIIQEQTIGLSRGLPIQFVVQAPNFDKLKEVVPVFLQKAQSNEAFQVVDVNLKFNKPELTVEIDRDRARNLGVTVRDIAETIQLLFSDQRFGYFIMNNKQYQIIGQALKSERKQPLDLNSVFVRNNRGEQIQLANVIKLADNSTPPQLFRYNRYVSATFSAAPAKGFTLGQGIDEMQQIADEVLDDSFSTALAGSSKEYKESSDSLAFAFFLALILIYLILSAQFESFRDPLIIMLTVPLAIAGAVLSLWMGSFTLNIFSEIGIIVLIGLVTKNGILIVEFANQRKASGLTLREAASQAASERLRPILMTSLATVLGMVPIAFQLGASSTSRVPMGITIVGGMIFSLLLTLFVIPVLYTFISKK